MMTDTVSRDLVARKPKPPTWTACESCPFGAALVDADGTIITCWCRERER